jgi:hypothetical protein
MFSNHPAVKSLLSLGAVGMTKKPVPSKQELAAKAILDAAESADSGNYALSDIRVQVASTIQQWVATDDLVDGENLADRLYAMIVGIADENQDGELDEAEQAVVDIALNAGFDYLTGKGVSEDDAVALLQDGDAGAADRVADLLRGESPEGDEGAMDDIDSFAFDSDAQASVFDSATAILDAVYKKSLAVRGGKKVKIMKRVAGKVALSSAQKVAIAKARMKSNTAAAKVRRMKSMRVRSKMGL